MKSGTAAGAAAAAVGRRALSNGDSADDDQQGGQQEEDEERMTMFLQAVKTDDAQAVANMIETLGDGVLGDTYRGSTCLHLAAERKDKDGSSAALICLLLDSYQGREALPDVDARDKLGFTPLHVACMHGHVKAVRELLRRGAAVGAENERGSTPLHWAASRGHAQVVKLLLGVYGADFAVPAGNGSTPLHWAASKGRRAVIEILLGTFCAQVDVKDDKGCTPCLMAALNGHQEVVELLIDRFNSKTSICDRKRTNLLHAACEMGHGALASMLIDRYHMSVEAQDRKGLTPLARAAQRNQVEVFRLLVENYGARLDTLTTNKNGLLHVACEAGALDVAKLLLEEHGFEVDARNVSGDTPALLAAARGNADVLTLLVEGHGASLAAADANGVGALHVACERRQSGVASVLLESYGVPADEVDPSGATALHVAARGGDTELVELLIGPSGKANIGLRDAEGNQALHIAAAYGHLGVVKALVENAGADAGARNSSDKSALDMAVGNANSEIADYLSGVLPDEHLEHHRCEKRAGFERAGRLMRLSRATGCMQDLALDNVYLLPVPTLLEAGRFPSHYDASRKQHLVAASAISPQAQVLLVSHPWESPGNPDPSGKQFLALRRFLEDTAVATSGRGPAEGESAGRVGGGFRYVWLSFSCTSSNRMKPSFQTHLDNVLTAWCFSDHALIIPETVTRPAEGFTYTDVEALVERGWCCVELLCALHLGVPTTVHVALEDAVSNAVTRCQQSPSEEADAALELLPPSAVFERIPAEEWLSANPVDSSRELPGSPENLRREASPSGRSDDDRSTRLCLSAGRCMTRAIEAASRRLSSSPVVAPGGGERPVANGPGGSIAPAAAAGGAGHGHRYESTEESAHIVNLIWSSGAEAYLDSITRLVARALKSLDDEVLRDIQMAAAGNGGVGSGDKTLQAQPGEGEVPKDSKAGLLLARVLNLDLDKQDVEEQSGKAGEAMACPFVRELYEKLGSFSSTHDKLDAVKTLLLAGCYFKGVRAASTDGSRWSSSPKTSWSKVSLPPRGESGRSSPPGSLLSKETGRVSGGGDKAGDRNRRGRSSGGGDKDRDRDRQSRSSVGGGKDAGTTEPMVAGLVPSCHVS